MSGPGERRLGARYRLDEPDGSWWELGWDRPLGTFYAQRHSPVPYDPFTEDELLDWHGTDYRELSNVEALAARLPVPLPRHVAHQLEADAAAFPNTSEPPFLSFARDLVAALGAARPVRAPADVVVPAEDGFDPQHPAVHCRLERTQPGPVPATAPATLPAQPLADALRVLHADPGMADDDLATFAKGLGLGAELVVGVLTGSVTELSASEAAGVCDALGCSPTEVWESEPSGRVNAETGVHVTDDPAGARRLLVTSYAKVRVLAVDADGSIWAAEDVGRPADDDVDYHLRFSQTADPVPVTVKVHEGNSALDAFGLDADHRLVLVADRLRKAAWPSDVDLVRFTDTEGGGEHWLGWDGATRTWQCWDDPRAYYPGNPDDVIQTTWFRDPVGDPSPQLPFEVTPETGRLPHVDGPEATYTEALGIDT